MKNYSASSFSFLAAFIFLGNSFGQVHASHPLDSLSESEIETAAEILRKDRRFPKQGTFPSLALEEPAKSDVLKNESPSTLSPTLPRKAAATILDQATYQTIEAMVDLGKKEVTEWKKIPGVQPLVLDEEYKSIQKIIKSDPKWQAAIRKRGIENLDQVWVDLWTTGAFTPAQHKNCRLFRGISYLKDGLNNFYGRPIEGVLALVDMNEKRVIELRDTNPLPVPKEAQELDPKSISAATLGKSRPDLKPLTIATPEGSSFKIQGRQIQWQNWDFRFGFHPREGLILYQIGYEDNGQLRPILYRASLSEMVVPYGDPDKNWSWRNAFDEGEYGIGKLTSPLEAGVDTPENAVFFDMPIGDDSGKPLLLKNAVALFERDGGLIWKHHDQYSQQNESRRGRQLVLMTAVAIGNYDYVFQWVFHQDGMIEMDVALTGIMLAKGVPNPLHGSHSGDHSAHRHAVAKNVAAPHHQHFFNFRLDFNVDGVKNSVVEANTQPMPAGLHNPDGNGLIMSEVLFKREKEARRDLHLEKARKWKIINPSKINELGYPSGYALLPGDNSIPYLSPSSQTRRRATFIDHHFWVTAYDPKEIYAGGVYPNQSQRKEGLGHWALKNRSIENTDIVAWYTVGVTHIPRPEEWPVMSVTHTGFKLVPAGFFTRNPALDVPKTQLKP